MTDRARFWGRGVWRHQLLIAIPLVLFLGAYGVLVGVLAIQDSQSRWFTVPTALAMPVLLWFTLIRPRLVLDDEHVTIVSWFRTRRYALETIVAAEPGYWGTDFVLDDGGTFSAGVLQRPNYKAWLGRPSRADKVATLVLRNAAELRGEECDAVLPAGRGTGDLPSGFAAALAVFVGSIVTRK